MAEGRSGARLLVLVACSFLATPVVFWLTHWLFTALTDWFGWHTNAVADLWLPRYGVWYVTLAAFALWAVLAPVAWGVARLFRLKSRTLTIGLALVVGLLTDGVFLSATFGSGSPPENSPPLRGMLVYLILQFALPLSLPCLLTFGPLFGRGGKRPGD